MSRQQRLEEELDHFEQQQRSEQRRQRQEQQQLGDELISILNQATKLQVDVKEVLDHSSTDLVEMIDRLKSKATQYAGKYGEALNDLARSNRIAERLWHENRELSARVQRLSATNDQLQRRVDRYKGDVDLITDYLVRRRQETNRPNEESTSSNEH